MDHDLSAPFLSRFFQRTTAGIKPGLQVIEALLDRLDHPERRFLVVHVAGTNGKGSVCAMLERILREAGFRTGLYTSPHLVRFHERIRVNGEEIADADVAALAAEVEQADRAVCGGSGLRPATFFELGTAMAFLHFARAGVQVAVVEVGMGGRWDATNVVHPLVSVITPVSMDHMEYLGDTLAKIAGEKAGVIKANRPVVCAPQEPEALAVITAEARRREAPWIDAAQEAQVGLGAGKAASTSAGQRFTLHTPENDYGTLTLGLQGPHQAGNAAVAVLAAERAFREMGLPLDPDVVRAALEQVRWPARFQWLGEDPPVILDGAHNPAGAEALAEALKRAFPRRKGAFVVGFSRDKEARSVLRALAPRVGRVWTVAYGGERAMPAADAASLCAALRLPAEPATLREALAAARRHAAETGTFACICGSLYLAGEVLALPPGALTDG